MTVTTSNIPKSAPVVPGEPSLKTAADILVSAMNKADLDEHRWESAGPLVSAAAQSLREALGTPVHGSCVSVPAVVREADFASAARPLLAGATVVDPEAARQFARLAVEAALALA